MVRHCRPELMHVWRLLTSGTVGHVSHFALGFLTLWDFHHIQRGSRRGSRRQQRIIAMMKLYVMHRSGNCWKVAWMLRLLQIPHEIVFISILDGSTKSSTFTAKNPNGQVPLLELTDGRFLAESNAIMLYLAEKHQQTSKYQFLPPTDLYERAKVYEWLFFEQYTHEPSIAVRRANVIFQRPCDDEKMKQLLDKGHHALGVMEEKLAKNNTMFLVGDQFSIADISLYAYTHVAAEGGYELERFPKVQAWLQKIREMPDYSDMSILEDDKFVPESK